ncbi:MAG: DUF2461 domain-containing protein [Spirochaetes bacterium]|nr:DUF2461 domain-containing protein [Spirochaetota bacterium]
MSKYLTASTEFKFTGFFPRTLDFLKDLKSNNSKAWFDAHKQDYRECLLDPMRSLVKEMGKSMLTIDPYLVTIPLINKTISRIYRDTRFSKDKSLFKNVMWITFKRPGKDWRDAPAYFFEISPDSYRYGMGFYSASKSTMDRFRKMIDEKPEEFLQAISFYSKQRIFVLEGAKYKKIPDKKKPEIIIDWYRRRNLYLACNRKPDNRLFSRALADDLISGFELLAPLYHYLRKIKTEG